MIDAKEKYLNELFPYETGTTNYLINISNKYQYVYFETPKVACSTIKKTLQKLEIDDSDQTLSDNVHDKKTSPLLSPMQLINPISHHLQSHFTFSFVRNPYSRILSCYLDKIVGNQWEKNIRLPKLGYESTANLSFEDFLQAVKKFEYRDFDIHWMPQSVLLSSEKIDLDFIGKQETFDKDFSTVLAKIKGDANLKQEIICETRHSVGANQKLMKFLNRQTIELIREIYYDDFKNYAYGFDPYFA